MDRQKAHRPARMRPIYTRSPSSAVVAFASLSPPTHAAGLDVLSKVEHPDVVGPTHLAREWQLGLWVAGRTCKAVMGEVDADSCASVRSSVGANAAAAWEGVVRWQRIGRSCEGHPTIKVELDERVSATREQLIASTTDGVDW